MSHAPNNDESLLAELVDVHQDFVRALALKLAPAPGLAEDVSQQVFLELWSKKERWDLDRDMRPLLASMTRNVARRLWREKLRSLPEETKKLAEHLQQLASTEDEPDHSFEEKAALKNCLENLPEKSRKLVDVHYYLGLKSVEIARQMQMKADAVRRALFRLREQLKKCVHGKLSGGAYD